MRPRRTKTILPLSFFISCLTEVLTPTHAPAAEPPAAVEHAVTGTVEDQATGKPVPGIAVYVTETGDAASADDAGRFAVPVPAAGTYHLAVVDPGYQRADVTTQAGTPVRIRVQALELRGAEVLVVAEQERTAPGSAALRREEVTRVPGARGDLLTAVKSLPGIANDGSLGMGSGGIVIRGASPGDSRILVDGFGIPVLYHFGGLQSVLPSEMIDDVRYTPGGFGVEQGRATGGTVEVSSRQGDRALGAFAELSFINAAALAHGPLGERGSFSLSARRSIIDAILPAMLPSDGSLSFSTLPRYYDYQARADYSLTDRHTLSVFLFGSDDSLEALTNEVNAQDPLFSDRFKNDTRFTRAIASHTYDAPGLRNKVAISWLTQSFRSEVGLANHVHLDTMSGAIRDDARLRLAPFATLLGGAELEVRRLAADTRIPRPPRDGDPRQPNLTLDAPLVIDQRIDLLNAAAWTAVELEPLPELRLSPGVRVDHFSRTKTTVAQPRLQAQATVVPGTTLRAAGGVYVRPPQENDEVLQTELEPERAYQATGGVEQQLAEGVTAQLTGFHTWRRDLITYRADRQSPGATDGRDTYVNAGQGASYGGELLVQARRGDFFGWAAYTLSRSVRKDAAGREERLFDYDQTHNLVLVASQRLGRDKRWQVGGRFQLTSGRPYTPVTGAIFHADQNVYEPKFGAVNSARVDTTHQLDLRLDRTWQFKSWKLTSYLDVSNVYANAAVVGYSDNFDYTERKAIKNIPILPAIGIRGEF